MKFNVQRWHTTDRWNRLRFRVAYFLNGGVFPLHSKPPEGGILVAKVHLLFIGRYAYNVYAYLPRKPLGLRATLVGYLTSTNRRT